MIHLKSVRFGGAALLLAVASAAQAHPGHASGLLAGVVHPFLGLDHLLAMVAVGMWSVTVLPSGKRWTGPVTFLLTLLVGMLLATLGVSLPGGMQVVDAGVALTVSLFGGMLLAGRRMNPSCGLLMVALAGCLHGWVHGHELLSAATMNDATWGIATASSSVMTGSAFVGVGALLATSTGMLLGSAALHGLGWLAGRQLLSWPRSVSRISGALLGVSGLALLAAQL